MTFFFFQPVASATQTFSTPDQVCVYDFGSQAIQKSPWYLSAVTFCFKYFGQKMRSHLIVQYDYNLIARIVLLGPTGYTDDL